MYDECPLYDGLASHFHISDNLYIKIDNNDKKGNLGNQWQSLISSLIWANYPDHLDHLFHLDHLDLRGHPDYPSTLFTLTNLTTQIILVTWIPWTA